MSLSVVIVEKSGQLKSLTIKDFKEEELYKKCGFKKADDFTVQTEWKMKTEGKKYLIRVYGKTEGRANHENKYDFPPPIDTTLFFGSCAIVAQVKDSKDQWVFTHLSLDLWEKLYEKLFGGFEDLAATAAEDEEEEDELANVPKEKKTKDGYLKDDFVVSDESNEEDEDDEDDSEEDDSEDTEDLEEGEEDLALEDIGSELSEEEYDYDSENEKE
jgi:hypothetical protein